MAYYAKNVNWLKQILNKYIIQTLGAYSPASPRSLQKIEFNVT
jgi:hypothetical protein